MSIVVFNSTHTHTHVSMCVILSIHMMFNYIQGVSKKNKIKKPLQKQIYCFLFISRWFSGATNLNIIWQWSCLDAPKNDELKNIIRTKIGDYFCGGEWGTPNQTQDIFLWKLVSIS